MLEFAIIAVPFFVLIFGIFKVGFVAWGTYELENATEDAARLVRVGDEKASSETALRGVICGRVAMLRDCASKLRVNLRTFGTFDAVTPPNPLDSDGNLKASLTFAPAGPQAIVLLTTYYEWPLINFATAYSIGNMAGGDSRLLQAASVFRSEPF